MDPNLLPLIFGLGGAILGSVLSPLITGLFKNYGDNKALDAAAQSARAAEIRWEREQDFERRKIDRSNLRDACIIFLADTMAMRWLHLNNQLGVNRLNEDDLMAATEKHRDSKRTTREELLLLAPKLRSYLDEHSFHMMQLASGVSGPDGETASDILHEFDEQLERLRSAMRRELDLEDPEDLAHNQPQLNEGTMSGDKQISS